MATVALLVATVKRCYAAARMPRALANAGFTVAVLTPKSALVEASAYASKIGHLPDDATPKEWAFAFAAMVKATSPRIVVPCDDPAFRLLQALVVAPPPDMIPALQAQLASLVRESLGDPAGYRASADARLLPAAAQALGVRVPAFAIVGSAADAAAFAATHGYPVVVRGSRNDAERGAALCADASALASAFTALGRADALAAYDGRLLVQAHVRGRGQSGSFVAWRGSVLAGWAGDKVVADPEPLGPATVLRACRADEVRDFAARLARGFGASGFVNLECVTDAARGEAYLLALTRCVAAASHCGSAHGADLAAALHAAVHGAASPSLAEVDTGREPLSVLFPQEWLRDPESAYLRDHPVDVPWDDPKLVEALLALAPNA